MCRQYLHTHLSRTIIHLNLTINSKIFILGLWFSHLGLVYGNNYDYDTENQKNLIVNEDSENSLFYLIISGMTNIQCENQP